MKLIKINTIFIKNPDANIEIYKSSRRGK